MLPIGNKMVLDRTGIYIMKTQDIHHISSIVGDAQKNLDFYSSILGLRLLKKTLNYDDKHHYHLYYGNKNGSNGIVTTFPMNRFVPGRLGDGQVASASYGINVESFEFWTQRLKNFGIKTSEYSRFNLRRIRFKDLDGLTLEFIESDLKDNNTWSYNEVNHNNAFKGIQSAELYSKNPDSTLNLFTDILGYKLIDQDDEFYLLGSILSNDNMIELSKRTQGQGQIAVGTVHHIAFSVENDDMSAWRELLLKEGYQPTNIKDRNYFKSLYFREKGGILIELATKGPGLQIDESLETLGQQFIIPKHFENDRKEIIKSLMPLTVREINKI